MTVFQQNGYPHHTIHQILYSEKPEQLQVETNMREAEDESNRMNYERTFYAPYNPAVNRLFRTLKKKFNIDTTFKKTNILVNLLFKRRPKIPPNVVYATHPCSCQLHYIKQIGRRTKIRNKEEAANLTSPQNDPPKTFQSTN